MDLAIAGRVLTAGIAIAPHRCEDRVESAVPVRYGGEVAGVLLVRWTIGAPHDLSRAVSLLTAAAAAAAPDPGRSAGETKTAGRAGRGGTARGQRRDG